MVILAFSFISATSNELEPNCVERKLLLDLVVHDGGVGHVLVLDLLDELVDELHVGPPGGGVPDVEPPPSVVAATLTRTRI